MLINIFLIAGPVYCAEETITNYASTSTAAASISTDTPTTAVRTINLEHNENSMVDKHNQFVSCPLEEGDSKLNFLESIYQCACAR